MVIDLKRGITRLLIVLSVAYWGVAIFTTVGSYDAGVQRIERDRQETYGGVKLSPEMVALFQRDATDEGLFRGGRVFWAFTFGYMGIAAVGAGAFWTWRGFKGQPS